MLCSYKKESLIEVRDWSIAGKSARSGIFHLLALEQRQPWELLAFSGWLQYHHRWFIIMRQGGTDLHTKRFRNMKNFTTKSVLIAEDHSAARRILTALMQKLGVTRVDSVANGMEALARIQEQPVELLVVDWNMPEMDGLELLKAIRANEDTKEIKVLMVTADDDKDHVLQAILAGADGYLVKPVTLERLEQKLEDIFKDEEE